MSVSLSGWKSWARRTISPRCCGKAGRPRLRPTSMPGLHPVRDGNRRAPVQGDSTPTVMRAHFQPVVLPAAWPAGVPAGLGEVLATALAKEPEARYAQAGELAVAVDRAGEDQARRPLRRAGGGRGSAGLARAVRWRRDPGTSPQLPERSGSRARRRWPDSSGAARRARGRRLAG